MLLDTGSPTDFEWQANIVDGRSPRKQRRILKDKGELTCPPGCIGSFAEHADAAVGGRNKIGNEPQQRGFATARWPKNGNQVAGTEFDLRADLVLIAIGFARPVHDGLVKDMGFDLDGRGNILADEHDYATSVPGVFAAGDARRGQSLVVWAIREGRQAARAIDAFLMGETTLPR